MATNKGIWSKITDRITRFLYHYLDRSERNKTTESAIGRDQFYSTAFFEGFNASSTK